MICFEVVDVLAKDYGPKVFAEELDDIEGIIKTWPFSRKPTTLSVSSPGAMRSKSQGEQYSPFH